MGTSDSNNHGLNKMIYNIIRAKHEAVLSYLLSYVCGFTVYLCLYIMYITTL